MMRTSHCLSILVLLCTTCHQSLQDTLLFAATLGDRKSPAGLYGAIVSDDNTGQLTVNSSYTFQFGYQCTRTGSEVTEGLALQAVSYDRVTDKVLLHLAMDQTKPQPGVISLYEGHVCQSGGCRGPKPPKPIIDGFHFMHLVPKVFASHNGVIYFLSQQKEVSGAGEVTNVIELRRLRGCNDMYPLRSSSRFDLDACSERLSVVVEESGRVSAYDTMTGLEVVQIGDMRYAFITLQKLEFTNPEVSDEYTDVLVELYVVLIETRNIAFPYLLDTEHVGTKYQRYILQHVGSIDYLERTLCWSAIDRVVCADFTTDRLGIRNQRYAVRPGGAADSVCKASDVFKNIITGVAIAHASNDEVGLFFGCMAGVSGVGGAGFSRLRTDDGWPTLTKFRNNTGQMITAGQLFLSHKCVYHSGARPHDSYAVADDARPSLSGGASRLTSGPSVVTVLALIIGCFRW